MTDKPVTQALKEIRESAKVGVREMARRLGVAPNSYTHYENPDRFKDPYLPMQWAIRFADALEQDGVSRDAILALAGATDSLTADGFDARLAALPPARQKQVLQYLADQEVLPLKHGKNALSILGRKISESLPWCLFTHYSTPPCVN